MRRGNSHPRAGVLLLGLMVLMALAIPSAQASGTHAVIAEVNQARMGHGLDPVRRSRTLQRSSVAYAHRMLDHQSFRHSRSIQTSRHFAIRGEVLARTELAYPDARMLVAGWLASPSHRAVLMNPRYRYIGVGFASGWVAEKTVGEKHVTLVTAHLGGTLEASRRSGSTRSHRPGHRRNPAPRR